MSVNGDMSRPAHASSGQMEWQASPSGSVSRKRFHLVGPPESGQVTSLVRYAPGAAFPAHDHPEGEEILVLSGIFSDEHGDWEAGTHLLNPEGFQHSPFSRTGCLLFVKLRQYSGLDYQVTRLNPDWSSLQSDQVIDVTDGVSTSVIRLEAGSNQRFNTARGIELFLLAGECRVNSHRLDRHGWLRLPPGEPVEIEGDGVLYLKQGAVQYLRSEMAGDEKRSNV